MRFVGQRTGLRRRVEYVLTQAQIELEWFFAQRDRAREHRDWQETIALGVNWGMTGEKPG